MSYMTDDDVKKVELLQRLGSSIGTARFVCLVCGIANRLQFSGTEIRDLNGDIAQYEGPCPECNSMSLCHDLLYRRREDADQEDADRETAAKKDDLSDR